MNCQHGIGDTRVKRSEFWDAVDAVYGPSLGRSLVVDLYLSSFSGTAQEALERGAEPGEVWAALIEETGQSEDARWVHRIDPKKRRR